MKKGCIVSMVMWGAAVWGASGCWPGCGISAHAAAWKVSADLRERYQSFNNLDFNSAVDQDSNEFDSRLFLKGAADFGHGVTAYFQPQAVLIRNNTKTTGTQSLTQADLYQAWIQYENDGVGVKLGRQTLVYGDQRLLGHLGWKDVARTFDGAKVFRHRDGVKLDAFAVHPADISAMTPTATVRNGKSLVTWEDRRLIGAYGTWNAAPKNGADAYFINWHHNQHAAAGAGRNINTFGARLFGVWRGLDGTAEYVLQRGTWRNGVSQRASALAVKAGYTFDAWKTRVGAEFDFSPGDDKRDATRHKDFVFPFHTNHMHYGEMDRFSWGNMKDVRFSLRTSPAERLTFRADAHLFWLDKASGDWLNVVGTRALFVGKSTYVQTRAGTEVDVKLSYRPAFAEGLKLALLYGSFDPGAAVRERNGGVADRASFFYALAQYAF